MQVILQALQNKGLQCMPLGSTEAKGAQENPTKEVQKLCMHACVYACMMYVYATPWQHRSERRTRKPDQGGTKTMYACMYVHVYVYKYICNPSAAPKQKEHKKTLQRRYEACMHVCMYACMHVCMYACVCIHIHLHIQVGFICNRSEHWFALRRIHTYVHIHTYEHWFALRRIHTYI